MTESNVVFPTWQSTWINLINQINDKWLAGDYLGSYESAKILFTWLPIECHNDVKEEFERISKLICPEKTIQVVFSSYHTKRKVGCWQKGILYNEIPPLCAKMCQSLQTHGWLSKGIGAKPLSKETPHIGGP